MTRLVWAFQPLHELNKRTGFVECDDALAASLIKSGKAQDPAIGATALKHIVDTPPPPLAKESASTEYDTKVMTPKKPTPKK